MGSEVWETKRWVELATHQWEKTMELKVIKHDQFPILNFTNKKRLLNRFIFSNDYMEWEVKFVKPRDGLKFLPSVGIEHTTTWLKVTRSTG